MNIERVELKDKYRMELSLNQLISLEKALYLSTKRQYDPDGYGLQFVLKNFIANEQKELKATGDAKATPVAQDKLNLRFGGQ